MRALILLVGLLLTSSIPAQLVPDIRIDGDKPEHFRSAGVRIAASGHTVYVFWRDRHSGTDDIYFSRSTDGGRTWFDHSEPVPGATDVGRFRVAVGGDTVSVVWKQENGGILCNRSQNQGNSWLLSGPEVVTSKQGAEKLEVAISDDYLYVVWREEDEGTGDHGWDIYFRSSSDRGQTWAPNPARLDTDPPGAGDSFEHRIAVSGDAVYVVWEDHRDGEGDIYFNRSLNNGVHWLPADLRLDSDVIFSQTGFDSRDPAIAAAGGFVYVIWEDYRAGGSDIYLNVSTANGNPGTWLGNDRRLESDTPGASNSRDCRIAASGDAVYAVWRHDKDSTAIRFNVSRNNGRAWAGSTQLNPPLLKKPDDQQEMEIAAAGNAVYVVWTDYRNGTKPDIYFDRSLDNGNTWLPSNIRLDTGLQGGRYIAFSPEIAASGNYAYVAWRDYRYQELDVFFNIAHAPVLPYGLGLRGSGGHVPKIGTDGVDPRIGHPFKIAIKDALGAAPCLIAMSWDRVEQPLQPHLGGTVYGDFFTPGRYVSFFETTSGPSLPGVGEALLQFPILNDPSLLGMTFYWQAFVVDGNSAAPIGVSHTGGLATTLIR